VAKWEMWKNRLEWMQLGKFVADCFIALGSWKGLKAVLTRFMAGEWAAVLSLLGAGLILLGIIYYQTRVPRKQKQQSQALATSQIKTFDVNTYFATAYASTLQSEMEQRIRDIATENRPPNREEFYVKLIANGVISFFYESTWAYVYRSQLLLLQELNKGLVLPLATAKGFYDQAAKNDPQVYEGYTFASWLEFLKSRALLGEHPNGTVEITVRGKDFLKCLTHWGRYPDQRKF
jgi:hypothetical protein